ncbi:MAG: hypothetical protein FWC45_04050 [Treponema sp.]|nr:hypothetical protein [Treponema sp.]
MKKTKSSLLLILFMLIAFALGSCLIDSQSEYYVELLMEGSGEVTVNWGDGTQKETYIIPDNCLNINHWCAGSAISTITINADNIVTLEIEKNGLSDLTVDLSACNTLTSLIFRHDHHAEDKKTALNLKGCAALTALYCYGTGLTALDVSGCTALTTLYCYGTALASLDVSTCAALMFLYCYGTGLTALDVSGCTALTQLDCSNNKLTALDVSACTALTRLNCGANGLTVLDLGACASLTTLDCYGNKLDRSALNALFATLPGQDPLPCIIYIYGNPGAADCDRSIAEGKDWRVIG